MAQAFDTSDTPHVTVARCSGDLDIAVGRERTVTVAGDEDEIQVERQGESLTITARDDCQVRCPPGSSVTVHQVDGSVTVQEIEGPLAIETVNGNATVRDTGPVVLRQVRGDLEVRGVRGDLTAESVSGDAKVRQISGQVTLTTIRGDLAARDLEGGANLQEVSGDVSLNTALRAGRSYTVNARGDIAARVEIGSGARIELEGSEVHCRLPLQAVERKRGRIAGTLGDGSAQLMLRASGELSLTERGEGWGAGADVNWESAMESWAQQFEAHMTDVGRKLEERLAGMPYVDAEDISRRTREATERARRQAERAAERAKARAERAARKENRFAGGRWSWSAPQGQKPASEPVSDQERMAILKMVEEKKITAEDAAKLLASLEGGA